MIFPDKTDLVSINISENESKEADVQFIYSNYKLTLTVDIILFKKVVIESLLEKYPDHINISNFVRMFDCLSAKLIDRYSDQLDFNAITFYQTLTKHQLEKYKDKLLVSSISCQKHLTTELLEDLLLSAKNDSNSIKMAMQGLISQRHKALTADIVNKYLSYINAHDFNTLMGFLKLPKSLLHRILFIKDADYIKDDICRYQDFDEEFAIEHKLIPLLCSNKGFSVQFYDSIEPTINNITSHINNGCDNFIISMLNKDSSIFNKIRKPSQEVINAYNLLTL